jgi:hypothetical protein
MSKLASFLHGPGTKLAVFYPNGCMVAVFPDLVAAEEAVKLLHNGGFKEDDAVAVSGPDVIQAFRERDEKEGLLGVLMADLSRFIGTEEVYTDHDLERAAQGAGFAVVRCPGEESKHRAWETLEPLSPMVARHYAMSGIEHLKGEL